MKGHIFYSSDVVHRRIAHGGIKLIGAASTVIDKRRNRLHSEERPITTTKIVKSRWLTMCCLRQSLKT